MMRSLIRTWTLAGVGGGARTYAAGVSRMTARRHTPHIALINDGPLARYARWKRLRINKRRLLMGFGNHDLTLYRGSPSPVGQSLIMLTADGFIPCRFRTRPVFRCSACARQIGFRSESQYHEGWPYHGNRSSNAGLSVGSKAVNVGTSIRLSRVDCQSGMLHPVKIGHSRRQQVIFYAVWPWLWTARSDRPPGVL